MLRITLTRVAVRAQARPLDLRRVSLEHPVKPEVELRVHIQSNSALPLGLLDFLRALNQLFLLALLSDLVKGRLLDDSPGGRRARLVGSVKQRGGLPFGHVPGRLVLERAQQVRLREAPLLLTCGPLRSAPSENSGKHAVFNADRG